jgi:Protein of unknown function (DUF3431)
MNTSLKDEFSGRIMEYNWQYIFTGEPEFCPPQHQCYCDGYGVCFGGTDETNLNEWLKTLRQRELLDAKLDRWREDGLLAPSHEVVRATEEERTLVNNRIMYLKNEAYRRGEDPRARAEECGREWKEGDGF